MIPLILLLGGTLLAQSPASAELQLFTESQAHMGTKFTIQLYAPDQAAADQGFAAAFARIAQCDRIMSDYAPESELNLLCAASPHKTPLKISDDLWQVLHVANDVSRQSGGAFDVTIGPITRLWRQARRQQKLPDPDRLKAALAAVGYQSIELSAASQPSHTARLAKANMRLDLGGIAQGYAAQAAIKTLAQRKLTRVMVNASGDIVAADPPPGQTGWKIGIAGLNPDKDQPAFFVRLANRSVSNSGDAFQFTEVNGKRYSHIVDPKTGLGLTTRMSVTLWHPDGTLADALASAVCVLGPEKGMDLINQLDQAAALFILSTDSGVRELKSKNFDDVVKVEKETPGK